MTLAPAQRDGAREALTRWPLDALLADDACDRLMASWGVTRDQALAMVGAERGKRGTR